MKKHILFFVGLVLVIVLVAITVAVTQNGLPGITNQFAKTRSTSFGGGLAESFAPSMKMVATDQASAIAPMAAPASAESANIPRKITKTANLSILVETAETTVANIQAIAGSMSGYVSDSNLHEVTPGVKAGYVTIRVPADKFEEALNRVKELALKVENESVNANDVTDQFIDLEARLKNLKAQEVQYLDILKKAQKVEDVLNVTNQLNQVRQQIDSWQGQLKYLNSQIDLSTITVNLTAEKEVQVFGLNWRPLTIIKQSVRSLLNGLVGYANLIIAAIIFLPVILLWALTLAVIVWIIWVIAKWVKKFPKSKKKTKK